MAFGAFFWSYLGCETGFRGRDNCGKLHRQSFVFWYFGFSKDIQFARNLWRWCFTWILDWVGFYNYFYGKLEVFDIDSHDFGPYISGLDILFLYPDPGYMNPRPCLSIPFSNSQFRTQSCLQLFRFNSHMLWSNHYTKLYYFVFHFLNWMFHDKKNVSR